MTEEQKGYAEEIERLVGDLPALPQPSRSGYSGGREPPRRTRVGLGGDDNPDPIQYISLDDAVERLSLYGYGDVRESLLSEIESGLISTVPSRHGSDDYWIDRSDLESHYGIDFQE